MINVERSKLFKIRENRLGKAVSHNSFPISKFNNFPTSNKRAICRRSSYLYFSENFSESFSSSFVTIYFSPFPPFLYRGDLVCHFFFFFFIANYKRSRFVHASSPLTISAPGDLRTMDVNTGIYIYALSVTVTIEYYAY